MTTVLGMGLSDDRWACEVTAAQWRPALTAGAGQGQGSTAASGWHVLWLSWWVRGWHSAGTGVSPRLAAVGSESMRPYTVRGSLWMRREAGPTRPSSVEEKGREREEPVRPPISGTHPDQRRGRSEPLLEPGGGLQRPRPASLGGPGLWEGQAGRLFL